MGKISGIGLAFMLFASLGFAWVPGFSPPSCLSQYTVAGMNFTYHSANASIGCSGTAGDMFNMRTMSVTTPSEAKIYLNTTQANASYDGAGQINLIIRMPSSGNFTFIVGGGDVYLYAVDGVTLYFNSSLDINFTTFNTTHYNASSSTTSAIIGKDTDLVVIPYATAWTLIPLNITANLYETYMIDKVNITPINYISQNPATNKVIHSDFTTAKSSFPNVSNYCQSLLYFNNPYYGNIQLVPKITYIPGIDAFADFINTSSNSAYLPNNTITYVFDSITNIWYIVPAISCTSYSSIASTSTLQYNPTATGTAPGGTVPIDVYYISGSCSYATTTRLITCTGTDTSGTITSLNLSAYLTGNTTNLCVNGTVGATGTLTCTLPAQNGTYNVLFYGTDANLFLHQFASKTITIGTGNTGFGRDAYIAVLLLVGVAALLMSSNIAVSMVLTCFGLFAALAMGALPLSDAPVVVFFTVIALVLAYRLKV